MARNLVVRALEFVLDTGIAITAPALAFLVRRMATTGVGTDTCLKWKCLPVPVHFYSPIPDLEDLEKRGIWDARSAMPGVDWNPPGQLELLTALGEKFGSECRWPRNPPREVHAFYTNNPSFSFGCAAALHSMVRYYRPRAVIEIGSGMSSRVMSAALELNHREDHCADYQIVDPYPGEAVRSGLPRLTRLHAERVETLDPGFFERLGANDILFVDSGHVVKTGGDVNFLVLEVLPRLRPGVIIHFHDISLPDEYARCYATNPRFRMFWTESYLVQAFLAFNGEFEVLLSMHYLMKDHSDAFASAFPAYDPTADRGSGSLWIRRKET
jgi:hypothetical protein